MEESQVVTYTWEKEVSTIPASA